MIVRDMFVASDDARVIARAIFEDRCRPQNLYGWITKYYAQLMKLKSAKVRKSDIMFYMSVLVDEDDNDRLYANVSGFYYEDINSVYFVDSYAKTYITEDLARLMEYDMIDPYAGTYDYMKSDKIQAKLNYFYSCIRSVWDTSGWPSKTSWEE